MKSSIFIKWSIALVAVSISFFIGAPVGAYIGEMYLAIPDQIAGAFLAVFMATATAHFFAPLKGTMFAFVVYVSALIFLASVFQPFSFDTLTYLIAGVFGGALALATMALTTLRTKWQHA